MRVTHLSGIDLNLLPLLDALLEERHVTRAAKRVGLSQPAASRGLARLRELLADPLLVRSQRGLSPTPRAEALRAPVRQALTLLDQSLVEKVVFDPATARRKIRVVSDDYSELVLFPSLVSRLSKRAPGIDVLVPPTGAFEFEPLLRGEIDLALAPLRANMPPPPGILEKKLYAERFVCVVRKGHPLAKRPTLARFADARHALIAPRGTAGGAVDDALARHGKTRRVAFMGPHFLVVPFIVAASDLVVTLGERVARALAPTLQLTIFEPPMKLNGFTVACYWHERSAADPAVQWFIRELEAVSRAPSTSSRGASGR